MNSLLYQCLCWCLEPVSRAYSLYSVGDGVILQHDVRQMDRLAIKLDDIISATNSHVRPQVSQILIDYLCFSHFCTILCTGALLILCINEFLCFHKVCLIFRLLSAKTVSLETASFLQLGSHIFNLQNIHCICFRMPRHFQSKRHWRGVQITAIWQLATMMGSYFFMSDI